MPWYSFAGVLNLSDAKITMRKSGASSTTGESVSGCLPEPAIWGSEIIVLLVQMWIINSYTTFTLL